MSILTLLANIPQDKAGHFIAGLLIYALLHFINPLIGLMAVAIAAIGKEVYDYLNRDKHTPDVWDSIATMLGGLIGFVCSLSII